MDSDLFLSLYLYIFIILALIAGLAFTKKIGPKVDGKSKNRSYESGIVPTKTHSVSTIFEETNSEIAHLPLNI